MTQPTPRCSSSSPGSRAGVPRTPRRSRCGAAPARGTRSGRTRSSTGLVRVVRTADRSEVVAHAAGHGNALRGERERPADGGRETGRRPDRRAVAPVAQPGREAEAAARVDPRPRNRSPACLGAPLERDARRRVRGADQAADTAGHAACIERGCDVDPHRRACDSSRGDAVQSRHARAHARAKASVGALPADRDRPPAAALEPLDDDPAAGRARARRAERPAVRRRLPRRRQRRARRRRATPSAGSRPRRSSSGARRRAPGPRPRDERARPSRAVAARRHVDGGPQQPAGFRRRASSARVNTNGPQSWCGEAALVRVGDAAQVRHRRVPSARRAGRRRSGRRRSSGRRSSPRARARAARGRPCRRTAASLSGVSAAHAAVDLAPLVRQQVVEAVPACASRARTSARRRPARAAPRAASRAASRTGTTPRR